MDSSKYLLEGTQNNSLVWVDTFKEVEFKLINKIIVQSLQNVMREGTIWSYEKNSGSEVNWFLRFLQTKLSNDFDFWCEVQ